MLFGRKPAVIPEPGLALPGRDKPLAVTNHHAVTGHPIKPPFPPGMEQIVLGLGCFWGAERRFWQTEGVYTTAVGYAGGHTPNPTYEEVCSGHTGHAEVVLVVYAPDVIDFDNLLRVFWESHDPTQGMRQGNDIGTQYRSAIYTCSDWQQQQAERSRSEYEMALQQAGFGPITSEITPLSVFYYAEDYHQQYLAKNAGGYCGLKGTGVSA